MTDTVSQSRPKLTRLEMQGFKSFATKTRFVFEPGITAVVGPNGSGKSNISDAVRWVLGETSHSALRSKKTEDVIFAGGKGKAPGGLAEVTVTFDNEDRWLPSEFTEVTVTRRAFRGGENQYLINGRKVRLKDVAQLTASLGSSYTVVGQGLVDAALSQRAEERRGLFEHAADLTGLRMKVQEAERNLAESDNNVTRLTDLLTEMEPQLRRLERSARQAKEWQGLSDRLTMLQRGHYRRLLIASNDRLGRAETLASVDQRALTEVQARLDALMKERITLEQALRAATDRLETHDARLSTLRDQLRRVSHERDLLDERLAALNRRRSDMDDTQSGLKDQMTRVEADIFAADEIWTELQAEVESARSAAKMARESASGAREARSRIETSLAEIQRDINRQERTISELQQRHALLQQRQETGAAERSRIEGEQQDRNDRLAGFRSDLAAFIEEDERIVTSIAQLDFRLEILTSSIAEQQEASRQSTTAMGELEKKLGNATNRLDVLQRLHESGTGLHQGVRQVMQWKRDGSLSGVRGTLQELIGVDQAYDTALEVALGGHLQDIVVDAWRDAEAAIGKLKQSRAGRATFQPIETVRRRGGHRPPPHELDGASGVHGVASDLVTADNDVSEVVRSLLGRIVVVDDLPTSRRVMDLLPGGWSTVTLAGEIARSGGSVTGGSQVRESGVLSRERELRDLPNHIRSLEKDRQAAQQAQEIQAYELQAIIDGRGAAESSRAGLMAQQRERAAQRHRIERWIADLTKEIEAAAERTASAEQSRNDQERNLAELAARREEADAELAEFHARQDELHKELSADGDALDSQEQAVNAAHQALAALEERSRAEERRRGGLQAQHKGLAEEMNLREQRVAELEGERSAMASNRERIHQDVERLSATVQSAADQRTPLADALETAGNAMQQRIGDIESTRQQMMERERSLGAKGLEVERARAESTTIRQRIIDDLYYEEADDLIADTEQEAFNDLPDDYEPTEREIQKLRDRLRRVGYVGEDVLTEFEEESARYEFMRTQLTDVQKAAESLRLMLAELHETMQRRFEETFDRVAVEFSKAFTILFGGGTARLMLVADEEGAPGGIDIMAQPPGKRLQSLSLLSGGERSLTAVALLFAILRVNPSPFVLLDEVDAALDEANVVRFRNELRTLAHETQAIVITHNRGTVEIADTLYGVTMGGDGVSQVLSLRLGDIPLDEDFDVRDLPAVTAGLPTR